MERHDLLRGDNHALRRKSEQRARAFAAEIDDAAVGRTGAVTVTTDWTSADPEIELGGSARGMALRTIVSDHDSDDARLAQLSDLAHADVERGADTVQRLVKKAVRQSTLANAAGKKLFAG